MTQTARNVQFLLNNILCAPKHFVRSTKPLFYAEFTQYTVNKRRSVTGSSIQLWFHFDIILLAVCRNLLNRNSTKQKNLMLKSPEWKILCFDFFFSSKRRVFRSKFHTPVVSFEIVVNYLNARGFHWARSCNMTRQ